jgi:hypothetical protein|tara:strand:+ start:545 stop:676 length:132 start_codon:yes stop_codon:yes gene_type:complete
MFRPRPINSVGRNINVWQYGSDAAAVLFVLDGVLTFHFSHGGD